MILDTLSFISDYLRILIFVLITIALIISFIISKFPPKSKITFHSSRSNEGRLTLKFKNTSKADIHQLIILMNCFDSGLNELKHLHCQHKQTHTIADNSVFDTSFNLGNDDEKMLHVRLSFRTKKIDEVMWFSVKESVVKETDEKIIWKLETGEDL